MAVAIDRQFNTLPELQPVNRNEAEVAWLIYDLIFNQDASRYVLQTIGWMTSDPLLISLRVVALCHAHSRTHWRTTIEQEDSGSRR
ncbi:MAG: hypothetical protein ACUVT0_07415 [Thermochromatium sp.]